MNIKDLIVPKSIKRISNTETYYETNEDHAEEVELYTYFEFLLINCVFSQSSSDLNDLRKQ